MKKTLIFLKNIPIIYLFLLAGCVPEQKIIGEARVLNKNGDICFAIADKRETRTYPMTISFIEFGTVNKKLGDKLYYKDKIETPVTPEDCFSVYDEFELSEFYKVWIVSFINKNNNWQSRSYFRKFYLTKESNEIIIHTSPFSEEELKRDNPRDPFPKEELIMNSFK